MNHSIEISIIIPIYNASTTLQACFESVLNQDFPHWEALLIDDGSNDNSYEVGLELAKKDSRIRVFQQDHQGVSAARNLALSKAQGKYVCFVDADDTIEPNYLSSMYAQRDYDMVICGYYVDTYDNNILSCRKEYTPDTIKINDFTNKSALINLFESGMININCNKLLKASIIINNNISYKNVPINEDYMFMVKYLTHSNSLCSIQNHLYHWNRTIGIKTGVDSLPANIIDIYNEAHILTTRFFHNETIANRILFFSYEIIIYKYLKLLHSSMEEKKCVYKKLKEIHKNSLVRQSIMSHKPQSIGEYLTYLPIKWGLFRTLYIINKILM